MPFRGLLLSEPNDDNEIIYTISELDDGELPDRPIEIAVSYSTVNYKDAMAVMGRPGIVRSYPMVPGVDIVGSIAASSDPSLPAGTRVTINGWDVGEAHWGGLASKARVEPEWITPLPERLSDHDAAAIGTAGYTAMLCVMRLEELGVTPDAGPVVVTGAAGGVGSVAIAVLAKLGFEVVAASGRADTEAEYLTGLGASEVIDREVLNGKVKPLARAQWAAGVDAVGSTTLANVLSQIQPNGVVAACGLAQGADLPTMVLPFILRGVTLAGINCVHEPQEKRAEAWNRLVTDLPSDKLASITARTVTLDEVPEVSEQILAGQVRGRVVVDLNAS